jgi:hypothetical protein
MQLQNPQTRQVFTVVLCTSYPKSLSWCFHVCEKLNMAMTSKHAGLDQILSSSEVAVVLRICLKVNKVCARRSSQTLQKGLCSNLEVQNIVTVRRQSSADMSEHSDCSQKNQASISGRVARIHPIFERKPKQNPGGRILQKIR